jgi:hypothetical protein
MKPNNPSFRFESVDGSFTLVQIKEKEIWVDGRPAAERMKLGYMPFGILEALLQQIHSGFMRTQLSSVAAVLPPFDTLVLVSHESMPWVFHPAKLLRDGTWVTDPDHIKFVRDCPVNPTHWMPMPRG